MTLYRRNLLRSLSLPVTLSFAGCQTLSSTPCSEFAAVLELQNTTTRVELPEQHSETADQLAADLEQAGLRTFIFPQFERGESEKYVLEIFGDISPKQLHQRLSAVGITDYSIDRWHTGDHAFEGVDGTFRLPTDTPLLEHRWQTITKHADHLTDSLPPVTPSKQHLKIEQPTSAQIPTVVATLRWLFAPAGQLELRLASPDIPDDTTLWPRFRSSPEHHDQIQNGKLQIVRQEAGAYEVQIRWPNAHEYTAQLFGLRGSSVLEPPDQATSSVVTILDDRKLNERPLTAREGTILSQAANPDYPPDDEFPRLPLRIPGLNAIEALAIGAAILHPTPERNTFTETCG